MQGLPQTPAARNDASVTNPSQANRTLQIMEGRLSLTPGQTATAQVISSEPLRQGQGYRIEVQLSNGDQLSLRSDRPLTAGQALQLQMRPDGQVDVRLLLPAALQQLANQALQQSPSQQLQLPAGQSLQLSASQVLRGEVLSSQASPQGEGYRVQVQLSTGQTLFLQADRPLPAGQQLALTSGPQSEPLARLLTAETARLVDLAQITAPQPGSTHSRSAAPASLQTLLEAASAQLRQALPRQAPLQQPLQQLAQLVRQLPTAPANTPGTSANNPSTPAAATATPGTIPSIGPQPAALLPTLREHLTALLQMIPRGEQPPTANQLQQFIPHSGLLLEANLARGIQTNPAGGDLKLQLQLASALIRQQAYLGNSLPPRQQQLLQQINQQLQAAESRLQVLQQTSLQATQATHERGQPGQLLQLDLPYSVRGDWYQAQLEIRRWIEEKDAEAAREEQARKTRSWEVRLSFDLKHWGKLHTILRLQGSELKADIWVESSSTHAAISKETEVLAARLRRIGAEVERVDCHIGQPPGITASASHQPIIDTRI
ncbi:flagellar hook-length control protein FliK [Marinospirillum alkaliphilum]|uniref:Hook-length control protein FliK n=1 Tax=Marinospirillum alkaliphilum DSM 21637 TaxID=1122209 RepID=A0A1K1VC66_9GAMM|nr:flagellar hook-length control protein FliK [Marinospirillum alkaliphilum]SFX22704.1 hook-length control protein FliK [Marinospirillum alkaliphilum DSM 21637]